MFVKWWTVYLHLRVLILYVLNCFEEEFTVFKIRSETCRTEAQFCQNLYIFIYDKEGKLAGPTQILPVNVRGPALILKTEFIFAHY